MKARENADMGCLGRCCAVALAVLAAVPACEAEALDCWLLSGQALDRARQQGMCLDTFARNPNDAAPPRETAEAPAAPPVRRDPVVNALSAVQQELERFGRDVERDLGLVGRALLQGGSSGTPSHSPHSGR